LPLALINVPVTASRIAHGVERSSVHFASKQGAVSKLTENGKLVVEEGGCLAAAFEHPAAVTATTRAMTPIRATRIAGP
jgi:hypothetical protein